MTADDAFEVLSNQRRRYAIHYLKMQDQQVELGDLSEHIASWENETSVSEVNSAERKRVYTSLQSHHLPKMNEQGIVNYDRRAGVVELTDSAADLEVYLDVVHGRDIPWSQYYLGLGAVNAGLVAAVFADAWPMVMLPDVAWAAFMITTIVASALVHIYHDSANRLGANDTPPELRD